HHLADLLRERAGQAAAEDREIVAEDAHLAPVDRAVAGHDAVAGDFFLRHVEVGDSMGLELVDLDERVAVEDKLDALARGHAALYALLLKPVLAAGRLRLARKLLKSFEIFFKAHLSRPRSSWIDAEQKGARHAPPASIDTACSRPVKAGRQARLRRINGVTCFSASDWAASTSHLNACASNRLPPFLP